MSNRDIIESLNEGDIIEASHRDWPEGSVLRGPVYHPRGSRRLYCSGTLVDSMADQMWTLRLVSRAPEGLYVNHSRTQPVEDDVALDASSPDSVIAWIYEKKKGWYQPGVPDNATAPTRFRLLVDGATGQVLPQ